MDLQRLRPADWLTGLAGVVLFLLYFAPWYTVSDGSDRGWHTFGFTGVWDLLTIALAIGVVVATALSESPAPPLVFVVLTATAALVAAVLALLRLLVIPGGQAITGRDWGVVLQFVDVLLLFAAACWAMRDERAPHTRPAPAARTFTVPAAGAGPRPTDS